MSKEIVPVSAAYLTFEDSVHTEFSESGKPKFRMVANSGKPMDNHWYWGNLIIDMDGGKFSKSKYPVLMDHLTSKKVGFSGVPTITDKKQLVIENDNFSFVDTESATEFISTAKEGFPWQASISARPTRVERLDEGESVTVNGHILKGPGSIWRKWEYKESSVTVFGADSNTKSDAFNDEGDGLEVEIFSLTSTEGGTSMAKEQKKPEAKVTLNQFKESNPEEFEAFRDSIRTEVTEEFKTELDKKETENKDLKDQNSKLSEALDSTNNRVKDLEKKDALRNEKEMAETAESIWKGALGESDIPERLHKKVRNQVDHEKFIEKDVLDVEAFTAAVNSEIEDWSDVSVGTSKVQGEGFSARTSDESAPAMSDESVKKDVDFLNTFVDKSTIKKETA